jgi:hypothetical protein
MYRVEYAGKTIEVQRNRTGVKKANTWIRELKRDAELRMKTDRIRRELLSLSEEANGTLSDHMKRAALLLVEDVFGEDK